MHSYRDLKTNILMKIFILDYLIKNDEENEEDEEELPFAENEEDVIDDLMA